MSQRLKKIFLLLIFVYLPAVGAELTITDNGKSATVGVSSTFTPSNTQNSNPAADELTTIATYLLNLGQYMGYNLENASPQASSLNDTLLTYLDTSGSQTLAQQIFEQTAYVTILGAIPVNTSVSGLQDFVPTTNSFNTINSQANFTFANYQTSSASNVSIIPNLDQENYMSDPVTQSVLNILSAEDASFCTTSTNSSQPSSNPCPTLVSPLIIMNTALSDIMSNGVLPASMELYTNPSASSTLSGQLNSNTLLSPLLYATTPLTSTSTSTSTTTSSAFPGNTQAQQAGNLVRYLINQLSPTSFVDQPTYSSVWSTAYPNGVLPTNPTSAQTTAQNNLASYFTSLRTFAAQSSVAINNLYGILAKRMPQVAPASSTQPGATSSQALSEYQLASWRIYNPQNTTQWVDQINTASSSTVQKEMAILLSEINYQLYLNRQQDEKILLTDSMLLIQALVSSQPGLNTGG